MKFEKAVKLMEEGKEVCYCRRAYDTLNPILVKKDNFVGFMINGRFEHLPIGCIRDKWELVEKKTLSDKKTKKPMDGFYYKEEIVKESLKRFIDWIYNDTPIGTMAWNNRYLSTPKQKAKEIFGEELIE